MLRPDNNFRKQRPSHGEKAVGGGGAKAGGRGYGSGRGCGLCSPPPLCSGSLPGDSSSHPTFRHTAPRVHCTVSRIREDGLDLGPTLAAFWRKLPVLLIFAFLCPPMQGITGISEGLG